jgi:hypothetical protein
MPNKSETVECFGREYVIRYDRTARIWYAARADGSTYEPIDAPSRDMAYLYLGIRLGSDPNF